MTDTPTSEHVAQRPVLLRTPQHHDTFDVYNVQLTNHANVSVFHPVERQAHTSISVHQAHNLRVEIGSSADATTHWLTVYGVDVDGVRHQFSIHVDDPAQLDNVTIVDRRQTGAPK